MDKNKRGKPQFSGEWVKLGDVASYINGYAFKPTDYASEGKPIIRIQDLTGNAYQTNRFAGILDDKYRVGWGDVLISWSASLGVYVWSAEEAWLNQHIFKVQFNKLPVNKRFFIHQTRYVIAESASLAHGATMRHLTKKVFDNLPFFYPSEHDQDEIACHLDEIQLQIDSASEMLVGLDALVKSRFNEMFGDALNSDNRWPEQTLGSMLDIARGGSPRPIKSYLTNDSDGVNWIKIGDAVNGSRYIANTAERIKLSGVKKSRLVHSGDFLLSNSMSFGRPYILKTDGCIHDGWLVLQGVEEYFDSLFLYQLLASDDMLHKFRGLVRGGVVNNLNKDLVSTVSVMVPPMSMQRDFASLVRQVDKLRFDAQQQIDKLELLKNSLMQEYFG